MAISKIQYENKEKTQDDPDKPRKNKVTDEDLNEIKEIVNNNADELINAQNALIEDEKNIKQLQTDNTQNKKDISNIKTEQTEQNNRLSDLEVDNTNQKSDIKNLKEDVDELYKDNTINKQEISKLKSVLGVETEEAKSLHVENADIIGNLKIKGNIEKDGEASLSNPVYLNTLGSNADGSFKGSTEIKISNGTDTKSFVLPIQKEMLTEDYFVKESDGWKEVHNWTKIIFDGTENWTVSFNIPGSTHKGNPYFVKIEREAIYDENQYCSHCSKCSYKGEEEGSFAATQNYFYFNPDDSEIASLSDLKDWLVQQNHNGTPLTAWYKCEEYKIACTDEQTTILDQLSNLDLYKGVDNITTTENIALLKLYYVTDIKSEQAQQNMNIENLQKENTELKEECSRLRQDLNAFPSGQVEGEYITLKDSADSRFNMFRIGGNSKQETRSGKNKFNIEYLGGDIITNKNIETGSFTLSNAWATPIMDNDNVSKILKPNTQYKCIANVTLISKTENLASPNNHGHLLVLYDGNTLISILATTSAQEKNDWEEGTTKVLKTTFTTPENLTNFRIIGYNYYSESGKEGIFNFENTMILESTEEDESFEQYGATPSPEFISEIQNVRDNANTIVVNKNLCNTDILAGLNNSAVTINSKNSFTIDLSKGNISNWNNIDLLFGNNKKDKQYTLSYHINQNNNKFRPRFVFYYLDGTISNSNNSGDTDVDSKVSSTNGKIIERIGIIWDTQSEGGIVTISDIQLEQNGIKTDFVQNEQQNFTFPLATEQKLHLGDYLADDGIHHVRKQIELDGTETWYFATSRSVFNTNIDDIALEESLTNSARSIVISSHFKPSNYYNLYYQKVDNAISGHNSAKAIEIRSTEFSGVDEFKAFLAQQKQAGTPVVVEYELATEEIEPYTEEQKKVYDQMVQTAKSYKNVTNIYSPDLVSPVFEVNYRKDIESMINNSLNNVNQQILNIV